MTIIHKIQTILKEGEFTQGKLAQKIGVSSVTLNSWVNGRSIPYKKHQEAITELFLGVTGELIISEEDLQIKRDILIQQSKQYKGITKFIVGRVDLIDEFGLALTYNSNRLEGSTLTIGDTKDILFNNSVIENKSMVEHLEARNHHAAWKYLLKYLFDGGNINEKLGLKLHQILMNGILENAGEYRKHNVRIVGSYVPTANYLSIDRLLKLLYKASENVVSISEASCLHGDFEKIHPFTDGNGRVGRLLLNGVLLKMNLPPAIIHQGTQLEDFIMDAVLDGFEIMDS